VSEPPTLQAESPDWAALPAAAVRCIALHLDRLGIRSFLRSCNAWVSALSPASTFQQDWRKHLTVLYPEPVIKKGPLGKRGCAGKGLALSPNCRLAVSSSYDNTLHVWDLQTGSLKLTLQPGILSEGVLAVSPDSCQVATATVAGVIQLWDLASGSCTKTLTGHTWGVVGLHYVLGGKHLLSASMDKQLRLWDLESGDCTCVLGEHGRGIHKVAVSTDGLVAASAAFDEAVAVWSLVDQAKRCSLYGHSNVVSALELSADGRLAAVASNDSSLRVWDTVLEQCLHVLSPNWSSGLHMHALAFSHDMRHLYSAGSKSSVHIWSLESGARMAVLAGHRDNAHIWSMALLPGGQYLLSSADNAALRAWDLRNPTISAVLSSTVQPGSPPRYIFAGKHAPRVEGGACSSGDELQAAAGFMACSRVLCKKLQERPVLAMSQGGRYVLCTIAGGSFCVVDVPLCL